MILESFLIGGFGMKYVCSVCAYTYDDDAEEVPFDELPDDWTCPVCTADKGFFEAKVGWLRETSGGKTIAHVEK